MRNLKEGRYLYDLTPVLVSQNGLSRGGELTQMGPSYFDRCVLSLNERETHTVRWHVTRSRSKGNGRQIKVRVIHLFPWSKKGGGFSPSHFSTTMDLAPLSSTLSRNRYIQLPFFLLKLSTWNFSVRPVTFDLTVWTEVTCLRGR